MRGVTGPWSEVGLAGAVLAASALAVWGASQHRFVFNDGARFALRQQPGPGQVSTDVVAQSRSVTRRFVLGPTGGMFLLSGVITPWVLLLVPETVGISGVSRVKKACVTLVWGATCAALIFLVPIRSEAGIRFLGVFGVTAVSISLVVALFQWLRSDLRGAAVWAASNGVVAAAVTIGAYYGVPPYLADRLTVLWTLVLAVIAVVVTVVRSLPRWDHADSWQHGLNALLAVLASQGLFSASPAASASLAAGASVLALLSDGLRKRAYRVTITSSVRISDIGSTVGLLSAVVGGLFLNAVLGTGTACAVVAFAAGWLLSCRDHLRLQDPERLRPDRRELVGMSALRIGLDRAQSPSLAAAAVIATCTVSLVLGALAAVPLLWAYFYPGRDLFEGFLGVALTLCALMLAMMGAG